jgi:hypothetical protein
MQNLDHERRLLSCMKDGVSFVNDELRLLAPQLPPHFSKVVVDKGKEMARTDQAR